VPTQQIGSKTLNDFWSSCREIRRFRSVGGQVVQLWRRTIVVTKKLPLTVANGQVWQVSFTSAARAIGWTTEKERSFSRLIRLAEQCIGFSHAVILDTTRRSDAN
jgi:hypothetical protein